MAQPEKKANGNESTTCNIQAQTNTCATETTAQGEPDGGDCGDSSSSEDGPYDPPQQSRGPGESSHKRMESPHASSDWPGRYNRQDERGRGVTNILRAYKGQLTFGGLYDEDL